MKIYDYIFYRFYNYYTLEKDKDDRAIAVTFIISLFEALNISSILIILQAIYKKMVLAKLQYIIIFVLLALANSLFFIARKRYKSILSKYNQKLNEDNAQNRVRSLRLLLYIIFSTLLLIVAVVLDSVQGNYKLIERFLEKMF